MVGQQVAQVKLIIGNRNYSSWSLRGWLACKQSGLAFEELTVSLYGDEWEQVKRDMGGWGRGVGRRRTIARRPRRRMGRRTPSRGPAANGTLTPRTP